MSVSALAMPNIRRYDRDGQLVDALRFGDDGAAERLVATSELKRRLDAGTPLVIVDLRSALDVETTPYKIPGARRIAPGSLHDPQRVIPKESEVVFYCAEPREATSARMAQIISAHGYRNVHPLSGGLEGWREAGFTVEPLPVEMPAAVTAR
jgi:rhodanese-related sulfurtransferase